MRSRYERDVVPRFEEISYWIRDGKTVESIAESLGISKTSIYEYITKHQEFADLFKKTKEYVDATVVNALYQKAKGYTVTLHKNVYKYKYNPDGSLKAQILERSEDTDVHIPPDTRAAEIWLSHRKKEEWGKEIEVDCNDDKGVVFLPEVLGDDDGNKNTE